MKLQNWHDDVFFGLHFDLHATENDIELGKDLTVEHLVRHLSRIQPDFVQCDCKGHPGYTSYPTKAGVPSPGIVKDAVKIWRQATQQLGIPLGMHYSGVWDTAALKLHPEWGRVHPDRNNSAGWPKPATDEQGRDKNMTCPQSAYTDTYMIPQLLEIIDTYDVDGFWVDGENWASAPCYCDICRAGFSRWLGEDAIVPQAPGEPQWPEWLAYSRENFIDHVRRYAAAVHLRKPVCTVCSNWMYTVRQPDPVDAPVDYISGDFSWIWSAAKALVEARFMDSRKLSWDLMAWAFSSHGKMQDWVFKSADALCQEAGVVLSCGGAF
ncbi:MAG: alpha-L-fucosidase, partial [Bacillota bacterium]|nr:alpha-L-fucosidase [Bacillota bacterium]